MAATAIEYPRPVTLTERPDFYVVGEIVEPGSRVLDLGCGEDELLAWLVDNKNVMARGVEISSSQVRRAIARGVSVFQGDIDEGLGTRFVIAREVAVRREALGVEDDLSRPVRIERSGQRPHAHGDVRRHARSRRDHADLALFMTHSKRPVCVATHRQRL